MIFIIVMNYYHESADLALIAPHYFARIYITIILCFYTPDDFASLSFTDIDHLAPFISKKVRDTHAHGAADYSTLRMRRYTLDMLIYY